MNLPEGKHFFCTVKVGERGQIVIPKEARELFHIKPGDTLLVLGDEEQGIAISKSDVLKELAMKILVDFANDKNDKAAGLSVIFLSTAMILFDGSQIETAMHIILRNFLMILVVGFCFPILYVRANEEHPCAALSVTKRRLKPSLILKYFLQLYYCSVSSG